MTTERYERAIRSVSPDDVVLTALEITHPDAPAPVRVVNDVADHNLGGNAYTGLRFEMKLVSDADDAPPRAEIVLDNIGRVLTQWIEQARGGAGATVRVMQFVAGTSDVAYDVTMNVAGTHVSQTQVRIRLGYEPVLGWRAVRLRHDPETSPGLF